MIITKIFRRLRKRLDGPGIAAEFDLRINHANFHNFISSMMVAVVEDKTKARSGLRIPFTRDRRDGDDPDA